jgi:polyisoprenoid-binding protein YceI
METKTFKIEKAASTIEWVGKKVTGSHNGTINVSDGIITLADGKLTGGEFTIATNTIKILDVTDAATNAQFAAHLASDDFFSINKYPAATLIINSVTPGTGNAYHVEAVLTIKAITHSIEFEATIDSVQGDTLRASATLIIDRTKYEMKFRSGNFFKDLGDTLIYNDFVLTVHLSAKAA